MSFASEHPVHCAMKDLAGCTASFPGSKWGTMKASREGWFHSRERDRSYCPEHIPDWVAEWRGQKKAT